MPHLVIEYTDNVPLDPPAVLDAAMAALAGLGLFDMASARGRIRALDTYAVDHPDRGSGFVACVLSILPGRPEEQRRAASQAVVAAVSAGVPLGRGTHITCEIRHMDRATYTKTVV